MEVQAGRAVCASDGSVITLWSPWAGTRQALVVCRGVGVGADTTFWAVGAGLLVVAERLALVVLRCTEVGSGTRGPAVVVEDGQAGYACCFHRSREEDDDGLAAAFLQDLGAYKPSW